MPALQSRRSSRSPVRRGRSTASNGRSDNVSLVYDELRQLIVWGQLPPGARIAERAVAERLGLSRTPVRSALHRLQQEGFVASSGHGTEQRLIVAPLTGEDGRELFLIIGHLEGLAARIASQLPRPKREQVVRRLRTLNRRLGVESRRQTSINKIFDLDMEFHRTYVEDVAGARVMALHRAIKPQTERYVRLYVSTLLDELPTSVKEHEIIVRAISRGDGSAAQRAVETNWHNAAERLANVIAEHGERGIWHWWTPGGERRATNGARRRS
jgi:DNA-binding GntR family transcriptional regulator